MITAVDSSVLLDVLKGDPHWATASATAMRLALAEGKVVACEVVWAEVGATIADNAAFAAAMDELGIAFDALQRAAALKAAVLWRGYRAAGGRRQRIAADFPIGAHALQQADRLLTRDAGFYRQHFQGLALLVPDVGLPSQ